MEEFYMYMFFFIFILNFHIINYKKYTNRLLKVVFLFIGASVSSCHSTKKCPFTGLQSLSQEHLYL